MFNAIIMITIPNNELQNFVLRANEIDYLVHKKVCLSGKDWQPEVCKQ